MPVYLRESVSPVGLCYSVRSDGKGGVGGVGHGHDLAGRQEEAEAQRGQLHQEHPLDAGHALRPVVRPPGDLVLSGSAGANLKDMPLIQDVKLDHYSYL